MIKYNINICDQIENELQIHFTGACRNKCPFCIDAMNKGIQIKQAPDVDAIFNTILKCSQHINGIGIAGGEPFLYINELNELITKVRLYVPHIKIGIISSIPEICAKNKELFFSILDSIDTFAFTPQHYKEHKADQIRGNRNIMYNRQRLYREIAKNYADKTTVNINVWKPGLCTKNEVIACIQHYNDMGFKNIKLCELFDKDEYFVNIEELLGLTGLKSPFAHGCSSKNYDITPIIPSFKGNITIKRVCFLKTHKRHATVADFIKMATRWIFAKKYYFGVVYENGELKPYWC